MTATIGLDPLISEFDNQEQEEAHTAWIKAELIKRRGKNCATVIPHDEVMRRMDERICLAALKNQFNLMTN